MHRDTIYNPYISHPSPPLPSSLPLSPPPLPFSSPPHCHFLHYKDGSHSAEPLSLLLWWEGGTQLLQYSLAVNPKAKGEKDALASQAKVSWLTTCPLSFHLTADPAPPLERVWPQQSAIACSSVNKGGSVLALGLEEGVVVVCDMKQGGERM